MATRWMKWNQGTHIFEFSTDGITFNPLPLDAAILTQGTINPARLPAGMPSGSGNNIFTGTNPITLSSARPVLDFNETDQGADLKKTALAVDGGVVALQKLDDAYTTPVNLLTVNRNGQLKLFPSASGFAFDITGAINTTLTFNLRNTDPGVARLTAILMGNDASAVIGQLSAYSSGWVAEAWRQPNAFSVEGGHSAGLALVASAASGSIRFHTGGSTTARLTITNLGAAIFQSSITERGRPNPLGEWIDIPHNAANFVALTGSWTVDPGDQITYQYCLIGKTMILNFYIGTSSLSAITADIRMALPAGFSASGYFENKCRILSAGVRKEGTVYTSSAGAAHLIIIPTDVSSWAVSVNNAYVIGQIAIGVSQG